MNAHGPSASPLTQGQPPSLGPLVLAVAGAWGYRMFFEIALGVMVMVFLAGEPRSGLLAVIVFAGLAFTRKMLVLDTRSRRAQFATVVPWFTQGEAYPFDALRPWVRRVQETTRIRRSTGTISTERNVRATLHLTATAREIANTTSPFHGYDRFVTVVSAFVGLPVDPAALSAALAHEHKRVWTRAIVTSVLAAATTALSLYTISRHGQFLVIAPALPFLALSAARWWTVFTSVERRARALPLGSARVAAAAVHGFALAVTLVAIPVALALRDARRQTLFASLDRTAAAQQEDARRTIAERPARGRVPPTVVSLPARTDAPMTEQAVRARLDRVGFRVSTRESLVSAVVWRLHASPHDASAIDVTLYAAANSHTSAQRIGDAWVSVNNTNPAARASVLRFIAERGDASDAVLGAALRAVRVENVTARGGQAWGWVNRQEFSVVARRLDEQTALVSRACTVATEGLLCAEIDRGVQRGDPNWARYALVVAADAGTHGL